LQTPLQLLRNAKTLSQKTRVGGARAERHWMKIRRSANTLGVKGNMGATRKEKGKTGKHVHSCIREKSQSRGISGLLQNTQWLKPVT
jgi:hypothetical protein